MREQRGGLDHLRGAGKEAVAVRLALATFRRKKHVFEKQSKNPAARHRPAKPVGL
jgi:hypothetical protein